MCAFVNSFFFKWQVGFRGLCSGLLLGSCLIGKKNPWGALLIQRGLVQRRQPHRKPDGLKQGMATPCAPARRSDIPPRMGSSCFLSGPGTPGLETFSRIHRLSGKVEWGVNAPGSSRRWTEAGAQISPFPSKKFPTSLPKLPKKTRYCSPQHCPSRASCFEGAVIIFSLFQCPVLCFLESPP